MQRIRPKNTWWRTVTADLKDLDLVWTQAEKITRGCEKWRLSNVAMASVTAVTVRMRD